MRVDEAIAAMRRDRSIADRAQSRAIAALRRWRESPRVAPILAGLADYGRGAPLAACSPLAGLFARGPAARELADSVCAGQCAVLAEEPFAQVPFRHAFAGGAATLLLARSGPARLTLVGIEPGRYPARSAVFSDAVRHDAVLAGRAAAMRLVLGEDGTIGRDGLRLCGGDRLAFELDREALCVTEVRERLVVLRLARSHPAPAPSREYDLAAGKPVRQACGDLRTSRHEVMLALLGRMRRREAVPEMARVASEPGADSLRWQALREALALDTATGFASLCDLARRPADPLAAAARALQARLTAEHPQLARLEDAACRG